MTIDRIILIVSSVLRSHLCDVSVLPRLCNAVVLRMNGSLGIRSFASVFGFASMVATRVSLYSGDDGFCIL